MTLEELNSNYNFLRGIPSLCYVTTAGSRAYGTDNENSDLDIRGFFMDLKKDIFGIGKLTEQFVDENTDTVIYSFKKIVKLLSECNPNTIELLGTRREDKIFMNCIAHDLIDNKDMFLSSRAFYSFGGYATAQLRRLENALARDSYPKEEKERHIMLSLESEINAQEDVFKSLDKDSCPEFYMENGELYIDLNMNHVKLRDFLRMKNCISTTVSNFDKIGHRNHKKDEKHLYKHAMHLLRLYFMCIDILKKGEVITYREKERDLLLSVRNGEVPMEKVFQMQKDLENRMQVAMDDTKLPKTPDYDRINKFVIDEFSKFYLV